MLDDLWFEEPPEETPEYTSPYEEYDYPEVTGPDYYSNFTSYDPDAAPITIEDIMGPSYDPDAAPQTYEEWAADWAAGWSGSLADIELAPIPSISFGEMLGGGTSGGYAPTVSSIYGAFYGESAASAETPRMDAQFAAWTPSGENQTYYSEQTYYAIKNLFISDAFKAEHSEIVHMLRLTGNFTPEQAETYATGVQKRRYDIPTSLHFAGGGSMVSLTGGVDDWEFRDLTDSGLLGTGIGLEEVVTGIFTAVAVAYGGPEVGSLFGTGAGANAAGAAIVSGAITGAQGGDVGDVLTSAAFAGMGTYISETTTALGAAEDAMAAAELAGNTAAAADAAITIAELTETLALVNDVSNVSQFALLVEGGTSAFDAMVQVYGGQVASHFDIDTVLDDSLTTLFGEQAASIIMQDDAFLNTLVDIGNGGDLAEVIATQYSPQILEALGADTVNEQAFGHAAIGSLIQFNQTGDAGASIAGGIKNYIHFGGGLAGLDDFVEGMASDFSEWVTGDGGEYDGNAVLAMGELMAAHAQQGFDDGIDLDTFYLQQELHQQYVTDMAAGMQANEVAWSIEDQNFADFGAFIQGLYDAPDAFEVGHSGAILNAERIMEYSGAVQQTIMDFVNADTSGTLLNEANYLEIVNEMTGGAFGDGSEYAEMQGISVEDAVSHYLSEAQTNRMYGSYDQHGSAVIRETNILMQAMMLDEGEGNKLVQFLDQDGKADFYAAIVAAGENDPEKIRALINNPDALAALSEEASQGVAAAYYTGPNVIDEVTSRSLALLGIPSVMGDTISGYQAAALVYSDPDITPPPQAAVSGFGNISNEEIESGAYIAMVNDAGETIFVSTSDGDYTTFDPENGLTNLVVQDGVSYLVGNDGAVLAQLGPRPDAATLAAALAQDIDEQVEDRANLDAAAALEAAGVPTGLVDFISRAFTYGQEGDTGYLNGIAQVIDEAGGDGDVLRLLSDGEFQNMFFEVVGNMTEQVSGLNSTAGVILSMPMRAMASFGGTMSDLAMVVGVSPEDNAFKTFFNKVNDSITDKYSVEYTAAVQELNEGIGIQVSEDVPWYDVPWEKAKIISDAVGDNPGAFLAEYIGVELGEEMLSIATGVGVAKAAAWVGSGVSKIAKVTESLSDGKWYNAMNDRLGGKLQELTGVLVVDIGEAYAGTAGGAFTDAKAVFLAAMLEQHGEAAYYANFAQYDSAADEYAWEKAHTAGAIAAGLAGISMGLGGMSSKVAVGALPDSLLGNSLKDYLLSTGKVATGIGLDMVLEGVEEAVPALWLNTQLHELDPTINVNDAWATAGLLGSLISGPITTTMAGSAALLNAANGFSYTNDPMTNLTIGLSPGIREVLDNAGGSPAAAQAAANQLQALGITDTGQLSNMLNFVNSDAYLSTSEMGQQVSAMFTGQGYEPSNSDVQSILDNVMTSNVEGITTGVEQDLFGSIETQVNQTLGEYEWTNPDTNETFMINPDTGEVETINIQQLLDDQAEVLQAQHAEELAWQVQINEQQAATFLTAQTDAAGVYAQAIADFKAGQAEAEGTVSQTYEEAQAEAAGVYQQSLDDFEVDYLASQSDQTQEIKDNQQDAVDAYEQSLADWETAQAAANVTLSKTLEDAQTAAFGKYNTSLTEFKKAQAQQQSAGHLEFKATQAAGIKQSKDAQDAYAAAQVVAQSRYEALLDGYQKDNTKSDAEQADAYAKAEEQAAAAYTKQLTDFLGQQDIHAQAYSDTQLAAAEAYKEQLAGYQKDNTKSDADQAAAYATAQSDAAKAYTQKLSGYQAQQSQEIALWQGKQEKQAEAYATAQGQAQTDYEMKLDGFQTDLSQSQEDQAAAYATAQQVAATAYTKQLTDYQDQQDIQAQNYADAQVSAQDFYIQQMDNFQIDLSQSQEDQADAYAKAQEKAATAYGKQLSDYQGQQTQQMGVWQVQQNDARAAYATAQGQAQTDYETKLGDFQTDLSQSQEDQAAEYLRYQKEAAAAYTKKLGDYQDQQDRQAEKYADAQDDAQDFYIQQMDNFQIDLSQSQEDQADAYAKAQEKAATAYGKQLSDYQGQQTQQMGYWQQQQNDSQNDANDRAIDAQDAYATAQKNAQTEYAKKITDFQADTTLSLEDQAAAYLNMQETASKAYTKQLTDYQDQQDIQAGDYDQAQKDANEFYLEQMDNYQLDSTKTQAEQAQAYADAQGLAATAYTKQLGDYQAQQKQQMGYWQQQQTDSQNDANDRAIDAQDAYALAQENAQTAYNNKIDDFQIDILASQEDQATEYLRYQKEAALAYTQNLDSFQGQQAIQTKAFLENQARAQKAYNKSMSQFQLDTQATQADQAQAYSDAQGLANTAYAKQLSDFQAIQVEQNDAYNTAQSDAQTAYEDQIAGYQVDVLASQATQALQYQQYQSDAVAAYKQQISDFQTQQTETNAAQYTGYTDAQATAQTWYEQQMSDYNDQQLEAQATSAITYEQAQAAAATAYTDQLAGYQVDTTLSQAEQAQAYATAQTEATGVYQQSLDNYATDQLNAQETLGITLETAQATAQQDYEDSLADYASQQLGDIASQALTYQDLLTKFEDNRLVEVETQQQWQIDQEQWQQDLLDQGASDTLTLDEILAGQQTNQTGQEQWQLDQLDLQNQQLQQDQLYQQQLQDQLQQNQDLQTQQFDASQLQLAQQGQQAAQRDLLGMLAAESPGGGSVSTPDPVNIDYVYDFDSIFANDQQEGKFNVLGKGFSGGGAVQGSSLDDLIKLIR